MKSLRFSKFLCGAALAALLLCFPTHVAAQYYTQFLNVDCSGADPFSYPSITAALAVSTDHTYINVLAGRTCNEQVYFSDLTDIAIATVYGSTFNLTGNLTVQNSRSVYLYGISVSSSSGDGIDINHSTAVTLEDSYSSNNTGIGLQVTSSDVTVNHTGVFDNNLGGGVVAGGNSSVSFTGWWPTGGHFDLIGNSASGLRMDRSFVLFTGSTTISNTIPSVGGTFPDAFGVIAWGGAKGGLMDMTGANSVTANQGGGIFLGETSEFSMGGGQTWAPYPLTIQGNGPYGVYAEFGGEFTIFGETTIQDHTIAGVDLYSGAQADIFGANQITHNGIGLDAGRAGIRVDGNSQAYIRGATISQNGGPGILELVNSSVDLGGSTVSSNVGGSVVCDGSAVLKSDLMPAMLGSGNVCRVAPAWGIQRFTSTKPPLPNQRQWRVYIDRMHAIMAAQRH